ncbi:MAG: TRAP transporter small permease [Planctomycetaceae bacterium]|nr:TRAP transporter small permease [Planctomycetaceae bacterium]
MRVLKWLDRHFEETVLILLLVIISCVMFLQVIMRYIFNDSMTWPEEFCRYCYVWTAFFSLAYTVRQGNMLRVAVVMDLLPQTARKVVFILVNVVCLIVFAVFFGHSIGVVQSIHKMGQTSTAMGWSMAMVYMCTVIGFGLAAVRMAQSIYHQIRNFNEIQRSTLETTRLEAKAEVEMAEADLKHNE